MNGKRLKRAKQRGKDRKLNRAEMRKEENRSGVWSYETH